MQVGRGLARRQAWGKLKATTNPTDEASAASQLQVQPGEKVKAASSNSPLSPWHLAVPRVVHHRRLTGVHQVTVSWGAVWSFEPAAVHRLGAPPVIHRASLALAIYFLTLLFLRRRSSACTLRHSQRHVTLFLSSFLLLCSLWIRFGPCDWQQWVASPILTRLTCQHYPYWGGALAFLGHPFACLNALPVFKQANWL